MLKLRSMSAYNSVFTMGLSSLRSYRPTASSSRVLPRLRQIRSFASDAVTKTPGEIKAEKRLRIITAVGAPIVIVAGLAALVINSPNMRARIESVSPDFVQYLRERFEFDGEDPAEVERVNKLQTFINQEWDMVARSPSGEVLCRERVPGSTSFREAEAQLVARAGGRAAVAIVEAEEREAAASPRTQVQLSIRSLRLEGSLWADTSPAVLAADAAARPSCEASGDDIERLFLMLYPPNIVSQRLMLLKGFNFFMPGKRSVNRKAQSSSRNSYTESIQRLQQRLRSLEAERRGGSMRPIDDVDAEIAQVQKEISSLKWASWGLSR